MKRFYFFLFPLLCFTLVTSANTTSNSDNPNVWNFQIARKVIAAFQFDGMGMSIWEDQGTENTTVTSRRQFYVTPSTEFLPNSSQCEYNGLTGAYFVSYSIQVWTDRLQMAAIDRLKQMEINVRQEQVQPLPFYQVRVTWDNTQQQLQKATLSTKWNSNLQQQSIQRFTILTSDKVSCDQIADILRTQPELFTDNIALEYSLSAASTATRTLTIKVDHFLNSQLMAALKTMNTQTPERYMTSDDSNRLVLEIMDNVVATQIVDGDYVPETDQLSMKDIITNSLQLQNADDGNFTQKMWESVYWDPEYARPDKITSYLHKILTIDQGNHSVKKSNEYSSKSDDGIDFGVENMFDIKGSSKGESNDKVSTEEANAWLLQHNYDVEIKGSLFIPKSLNLKRVNLGVLNRQETIFSKSVQMKHVDTPGTLRVTVGKNTNVESEDVKKLRERMDDLSSQLINLGQQLQNNTIEYRAQLQNYNSSISKQLSGKLSRCRICARWSNIACGLGPVWPSHGGGIHFGGNNCRQPSGGPKYKQVCSDNLNWNPNSPIDIDPTPFLSSFDAPSTIASFGVFCDP